MFLFPDVWASVCMVAPHSEHVTTYKRTIIANSIQLISLALGVAMC
jgi:hypothetical protein